MTTNMPAGTGYGKVRFMINGQEEYIINDINGFINREAVVTIIRTNSMVKTMVDKTFGIFNQGSTIYMNHLHIENKK